MGEGAASIGEITSHLHSCSILDRFGIIFGTKINHVSLDKVSFDQRLSKGQTVAAPNRLLKPPTIGFENLHLYFDLSSSRPLTSTNFQGCFSWPLSHVLIAAKSYGPSIYVFDK